ncbi:MAG: cytochrome c oxidase assembly protein [Alphaproteobacteria bacterium]
MRFRLNKLFLVVIAVLLLSLPMTYLLKIERPAPATGQQILVTYLRALYARDFKRAYRLISMRDRELKSENVYVKEQGEFTGFTAKVAHRLSDWIKARLVEQRVEGDRMRITLQLTLPDANALGPLLLDWDEDRLNKLARKEQKTLLAALEQAKREGKLSMIEGNQDFVLVKEGPHWKVFLDWAAGVHVIFDAVIPQGNSVEAQPLVRETVVHPGDLFTVDFRVKNRTAKDLVARIAHHVEPSDLAEHLDLVECALLFPVRIPPHQEQTYTSRYLLRGDLPEGAGEIRVTYDFTLER